MSVNVTEKSQIQTIETLESGVPAADQPQITSSGYDTKRTLTANSTPPATNAIYMSKALTAGAATIDLTSLPGPGGTTVDGTGKKVQSIRIVNGTTGGDGSIAAGSNASVNVAPGASNGYALFGASKDVDIPAGACLHMQFNENLADISSGAKTIDLAGTGTNAFEITIILG